MYSCLNTHTHYSLLRSTIKPKPLVTKAVSLGIPALAITDYNSISGAISFIKECKAKKVKWIVGSKILFRDTSVYVTILAKNFAGWKNLIKLISEMNRPENIEKDGQTSITFDTLNKIDTTGLICIFEHGYSSSLFDAFVDKFQEFYMGLTIIPGVTSKDHADEIRKKAQEAGKRVVALPSPHYLEQVDNRDLLVLLASKLKTTIPNLIDASQNTEYAQFTESSSFNLPSYDELKSRGYLEEELNETHSIAELCEQYDVFSNPNLPQFKIPKEFESDSEYLKHLCRLGWKERIAPIIDAADITRYGDRVKAEFDAIKDEPRLASYFLMVADYVNWLRQYSIVGAGRGSVGGSMIAYLTGITDVDPIKYDLLFSRFFNTARRGSLPDIDVDVPVYERENVITYIRQKYGYDKTCQVCTFGRLQGRGVLKEVLRVHNVCSMTEMNKITEFIPDEAKIADDLEEMRKTAKDLGIEEEEPSIIMWALEHHAKDLKDWCSLGKDGRLEGPYSLFFEQAIRLEYTLKSQGRHAAALLVSNDPIIDTCPLIYDKGKNSMLAGFEYENCELLGLVKIDILGLACLDKLAAIEKLVNERHFKQELVNA